jgi:ferritin
MLNKKVEDICNRQVEREGYSSNLYLAMASWAENQGMAGIASWLYVQADEEKLHMLKFIKYINERGSKAIIPAFKKPVSDFKGAEDVFAQVLKHEEFVTASINEIVQVTLEVKDYTTHNFLQWFVNEQIQEEASARTILDKLRLVGKNNMYIFDRDILGLRAAESNAKANQPL